MKPQGDFRMKKEALMALSAGIVISIVGVSLANADSQTTTNSKQQTASSSSQPQTQDEQDKPTLGNNVT